MKKVWMNVTVLLLTAVCLLYSIMMPVSAAETENVPNSGISGSTGSLKGKEEVVYANLSAEGAARDAYIVNILHVGGVGLVSDFGSYTSVKNLTSLEDMARNGDQIRVAAQAGSFYYQGQLEKAELPWSFRITYRLDGQVTAPADLAGRSGRTEIRIQTRNNPDADPLFFENYMLQVTLTLNTQRCGNIAAPGATLANAGENKLVTFTVLPGKEGDLRVTADVTEFAMEGIDISAVPFSMDLETPDTSALTDQMDTLSGAVEDLYEGSSALEIGAKSLYGGASTLKSGFSRYRQGLSALNGGSKDLLKASDQIQSALRRIQSALDNAGGVDLSELEALPSTLKTLSKALKSVKSGLDTLNSGFSTAFQTLDTAMADIPGQPVSQEAIQALYEASPENSPAIKLLVDYYASASKVKGVYQSVKPAFSSVNSTLKTVISSLNKTYDGLDTMADELGESLEGMDPSGGLSILFSGLSELNKNYSQFHEGLNSYTQGVSELNSSCNSLSRGISDLSGGAGSLYRGIGSLTDGMAQFKQGIQEAPDRIQKSIDEIMSDYDRSDFKPVSFADLKNENVMAVQFVFKTEKIEVAPEQRETEQTTKKEPNFWTRLAQLFS